jgi:putative ABC transport system permease protein
MLERIRALPGVESAGVGSNSPLMGGWQTGFYREGIAAPTPSQMPSADLEVVSGDYFSAFKAPLLRGRTFTASDTANSPRVIVVDQAMADQIFPGEDPIGKRLMVDAGNDDEGYQPAEIIGVVGRMRFHALDETVPFPLIYCTMSQAFRPGFALFVRAANAGTLERSIRDIVRSIDPAQPIYDFRLMQDRVAETWGTQRLLTFLFSIFAALALLLAGIGLYGVMAYTTSKRVREFGVRLALGAQPEQIRTLILSHGLQLLVAGSAIGLVGAFAVSRFLRRILFESGGSNPQIFLTVAVLMTAATALACWIPARRASRVDPMVALRAE